MVPAKAWGRQSPAWGEENRLQGSVAEAAVCRRIPVANFKQGAYHLGRIPENCFSICLGTKQAFGI